METITEPEKKTNQQLLDEAKALLEATQLEHRAAEAKYNQIREEGQRLYDETSSKYLAPLDRAAQHLERLRRVRNAALANVDRENTKQQEGTFKVYQDAHDRLQPLRVKVDQLATAIRLESWEGKVNGPAGFRCWLAAVHPELTATSSSSKGPRVRFFSAKGIYGDLFNYAFDEGTCELVASATGNGYGRTTLHFGNSKYDLTRQDMSFQHTTYGGNLVYGARRSDFENNINRHMKIRDAGLYDAEGVRLVGEDGKVVLPKVEAE